MAGAPFHRLRLCRYLLQGKAVVRLLPFGGRRQGRKNAKTVKKQSHRPKHVCLALRTPSDDRPRFTGGAKILDQQEPHLD